MIVVMGCTIALLACASPLYRSRCVALTALVDDVPDVVGGIGVDVVGTLLNDENLVIVRHIESDIAADTGPRVGLTSFADTVCGTGVALTALFLT